MTPLQTMAYQKIRLALENLVELKDQDNVPLYDQDYPELFDALLEEAGLLSEQSQ